MASVGESSITTIYAYTSNYLPDKPKVWGGRGYPVPQLSHSYTQEAQVLPADALVTSGDLAPDSDYPSDLSAGTGPRLRHPSQH